jgi:hypothetical protein
MKIGRAPARARSRARKLGYARCLFKEKIWVARHGRPRKSVFRNGFDKLRRSLMHPLEVGMKEIFHYIYLLRDPKCPLDMV